MVQLPKKYFPAHCHTVMTQQHDATTYYLFLKSLPHYTLLTSTQTFWEFCQETEAHGANLASSLEKHLRKGGQSAL